MKKYILTGFAILTILLFLTGCSSTQKMKLECKQFGNIGASDAYCIDNGYDSCVSATLIWSVLHEGDYEFITFPMECNVPYDQAYYKSIIDDRLNLQGAGIYIDDDSMVTCCKFI